MYIEAVPNRGSPPAILLRESYREAGKVKKRTLLNLSDWPHERIAGFKALLKGGTVIPQDQDAITIIRSLPHGHVEAALGTARKIGLDRLLGPDGNRCRDLILALVVSRILDPGSKLAAARALSPDTATSSLGEQLALGVVDEDELYSALDWLAVRQPAIEAALAKRHFTGGTLVLYDVSSSYLEGRCCALAQFGSSRDGKRGKLQIVYGLLCAPDGCPVAIEVFSGSTADPTTLTSQVTKLKERFGLDHVVLVGDRGMITQARITEDLKAAGLDWITALRAPAIKALLDDGALQMSLFDDRDMAGITSPAVPARPPRSAPASARICSPRPSATSPGLPQPLPASASRCAAKLKSASRSAPCSTSTRWPSTSPSTLPTPASASPERPTKSPWKRHSTASTSCAPACPPPLSTTLPRCAATNPSAWWSAPSAASRRSISRSGRSITGWPIACVPTCFFACSPTIWNGICASAWRPCFTTTPTRTPPKRNAPASSLKPSAPPPPSPSKPPAEPTTASRSTASEPFSTTSPPSPETPSLPPSPPSNPLP